MRTIDGGIVALGSGLALSAAGATWKAASLRSDLVASFQGRLALAQAALDERAAASLRMLAERVNKAMGDLERFDPHQALADPSELLAHVKSVERVLTARKKLPGYFRGMLRVGPMLTVLFAGLVIAILVALTYFSGWKRSRGVGYGALWGALALTVAIAAVGLWYVSVLHRFSGAEVLGLEEE